MEVSLTDVMSFGYVVEHHKIRNTYFSIGTSQSLSQG